MKPSVLALAILCTLTPAARAASNDGIVGAYARVEVGRSYFALSNTSPQMGSDDHANAVKLFGGFRFDEHLGVELGYAALGSFGESAVLGAASATQDLKARSAFAAVTGKLPVRDSFALHGRLGLSSGKVSGTDLHPPGDALTGSKTSVLFGVGVEYRPRSNLALTLNYDSYGKLSNEVKASALVIGLHFTL